MDLTTAFSVLADMLENFANWYPASRISSDFDLDDYANRFAGVKLSLEIGEYDWEDYQYLQYVRGLVLDNPLYYMAINVFISALAKEYDSRWESLWE